MNHVHGSAAPIQKLVFVLLSLDGARSLEFESVLAQAMSARALDLEVQLFFTGSAIDWLLLGVAETYHCVTQPEMSMLDLMQQAVALGVQFHPCSPALQGKETALLEFVSEPVGATYLVEVISHRDTQVLSY